MRPVASTPAAASTFAWTVNGTPAGTGETLSAGFVGGDLIRCTVTPADGYDTGTPLFAEVGTAGSAPSIASVSITPDPATAAESLSWVKPSR